MGPINSNKTVVPAAFGKMVPPVGLQTNVEQNWILARDILVREARFTSSQQAHFLLFMRMSALGRLRPYNQGDRTSAYPYQLL